MQQLREHDRLLIMLALGIMFIMVISSIIKINYFIIPHTIFHTIGLMLAIFLITISIKAYKRVKSSRFVLLTLGFIGFVIMESINLIYTFLQFDIPELNILNIELSHIFGVYVLVLLVLATLRGDKK